MCRISAYAHCKRPWYAFARPIGAVRNPAFIPWMPRCLNRTVELRGCVAGGRRIDKTTLKADPALLVERNTLLDLNLRRPGPKITGACQTRLCDGSVGGGRQRRDEWHS